MKPLAHFLPNAAYTTTPQPVEFQHHEPRATGASRSFRKCHRRADFEDFSQGSAGGAWFLPRAHLSYRDTNLRLGVLARNFQTIDQALLPADRPYTEFPRAYAQGDWNLGGVLPLEYGFRSESTAFHRGTGVEGWRTNVVPQAALRYEGPGFIKPALEPARDAVQPQ